MEGNDIVSVVAYGLILVNSGRLNSQGMLRNTAVIQWLAAVLAVSRAARDSRVCVHRTRPTLPSIHYHRAEKMQMPEENSFKKWRQAAGALILMPARETTV